MQLSHLQCSLSRVISKRQTGRVAKAATSALGVILEGPSIEKPAPLVCLLFDRMEDPNMVVRCTAVCTLRRVFELLRSPACANRIFTDANLPRIVAVLAKTFHKCPRKPVELYIFLPKVMSQSHLSFHLSLVIFSMFSFLLQHLLRRPLSGFQHLHMLIYEALCEVAVRVSNLQDYKASVAIGVLMPRVMRRLNTVLDAKASLSGDRMNKYDLLVLLCGVLHVIIKKLGNTFALWRTPFVLLLFCRVLTRDGSAARDKAALAIGALARVIGPDFADHMPILLQYFKVKRLFPTYLRVIGNIFHVLGDRILPYCDDMMDVLYRGLSKPTLKPAILECCFGEIALAIGKNFDKYLEALMKKLKDAADPGYYDDVLEDDEVEYGNRLRQGIFKAYSGILRSIKDPESGFKVGADLLFLFTQAVCKDRSRDSSLKNTAVGDFCTTLGSWTNEMIKDLMKC